MMNYNAAQLTLRHRQRSRLEYTINDTFSKAMTKNPGFLGTAGVSGVSAYWQDAYHGHVDHGPSGFDTRHNASATAAYGLPEGQGKKDGANLNQILYEAVGFWKVTAAAIAYSGLPGTINGPNTTAANNRASRANHYQHEDTQNCTLKHWYGTGPTVSHTEGTTVINSCTTAAAQARGCAYGPSMGNQFASASGGSEPAPGFDQIDMSTAKECFITKSQAVEFGQRGKHLQLQ